MLPEKSRLKVGQSNYRNWAGKKEIYTPLFKLIYRKREGQVETKIGFVVTGKIGKATKRNKIRRWLSEVVRSRIERFPKGTEAVFIASRPNEEIKYEKIIDWIDKILPRID